MGSDEISFLDHASVYGALDPGARKSSPDAAGCQKRGVDALDVDAALHGLNAVRDLDQLAGANKAMADADEADYMQREQSA